MVEGTHATVTVAGVPGVVSAALLAEVSKKVREQGLVLWVDTDGQYTGFVDRVAEQTGTPGAAFAYPVVRFRHSFLELMLALEPYGNGLHPEHVLIHLPGLNKDSVRQTPVFELYQAGKVFEKNLVTLVREGARGEARPDEVEAFLAAHAVSLEAADAWLAGLRATPRDEFSLRVEAWGLADTVFRAFREDTRLAEALPGNGQRLFDFLEKGLGVTPGWCQYLGVDRDLTPGSAAVLVSSWLMAVEFVSDLAAKPVTPELAPLSGLGPYREVCRSLVERLRADEPDRYLEIADGMQRRLLAEQQHPAAALGSIDTFRFEEAATRAAALAALKQRDFSGASRFTEERTPEKCFWVRRDPDLQKCWEVMRLGAELGRELGQRRAPLQSSRSLEEALERYTSDLAVVDRLHRQFEQRAHAAISFALEDYDQLLEVRRVVNAAYREYADALCSSFAALCRTFGPLPAPELRQRQLFDEVVCPLLDAGGRVAFFMVDALRFEMALALAEDFKRDKFQVTLKARYAELPTLTSVGMNALAPLTRKGKLGLVLDGDRFGGLRHGEYTVRLPADRVRAMSERVGGAGDIELEELTRKKLAELKRWISGKPRLLVVRSRELDDAGETGLHLPTFDQTLSQLRSAVSLLQQAGVEKFVIAADHGFLLQDPDAARHPFGSTKRSADRRHALTAAPSGMPGVLELSLAALDYETESPGYLVFREDTALWDAGTGRSPFVHGGNSLQERVIPVLLLERQGRRGKTTSKYEISAEPEVGRLGRQRLRLSVRLKRESPAALSFHAPKSIALSLRIPGRSDVQLTLLDASPPGELTDGRLLLPPNGEPTLVEFELEGETDEKLRVEVFHPDAVEEVEPKVVEGFFEVFRNRRLTTPPAGVPGPTAPVPGPAAEWRELIEDPGFRAALVYIEERRSMNEAELGQVLGSARRVRMFALKFDELVARVPFTVEIAFISGLKTYLRKD